jgi:hypothetical protein
MRQIATGYLLMFFCTTLAALDWNNSDAAGADRLGKGPSDTALIPCTGFDFSKTCVKDPDVTGRCEGEDDVYVSSNTPCLKNCLASNVLTCSGTSAEPQYAACKVSDSQFRPKQPSLNELKA